MGFFSAIDDLGEPIEAVPVRKRRECLLRRLREYDEDDGVYLLGIITRMSVMDILDDLSVRELFESVEARFSDPLADMSDF